MLLPDWIYSRIPHIWLFIGLLFLFIGLMAGSDFRLFYAYLLLVLVCLLLFGLAPAWMGSRKRD